MPDTAVLPPSAQLLRPLQGTVAVPVQSWRTARDRTLALLLAGERRLLVTGVGGTGKTLLLQDVARVLRAAGWEATLRSPADHAPQGEPVRPAASSVVIVDEADRLSRKALRALDQAEGGALLLAGLTTLADACPRWTRVTLSTLSLADSTTFVALWLKQSGLEPAKLGDGAAQRAAELSEGIPRVLTGLLTGAIWLAAADGSEQVSAAHVDEAAAFRNCLAGPDDAGAADQPGSPKPPASATRAAAKAMAPSGSRKADDPPFARRVPMPAKAAPAGRPGLGRPWVIAAAACVCLAVSVPAARRDTGLAPDLAASQRDGSHSSTQLIELAYVQQASVAESVGGLASRVSAEEPVQAAAMTATAPGEVVADFSTATTPVAPGIDTPAVAAGTETAGATAPDPAGLPDAGQAATAKDSNEAIEVVARPEAGPAPSAATPVPAAPALADPPPIAIVQPEPAAQALAPLTAPTAPPAEAATPPVADAGATAAVLPVTDPPPITPAIASASPDAEASRAADASVQPDAVPPAMPPTAGPTSPAEPVPAPVAEADAAVAPTPPGPAASPAETGTAAALPLTDLPPPPPPVTAAGPDAEPSRAAGATVQPDTVPPAMPSAAGQTAPVAETVPTPVTEAGTPAPPPTVVPTSPVDGGSAEIAPTAAGSLQPSVPASAAPTTGNVAPAVEAEPAVAVARGAAVSPAAVAPPPPDLPPGTLTLLISRGERLIKLGDISGARLVYGRAAASGSGKAALHMGQTFDPSFLTGMGARIAPSPAEAAEWYRRAASLGEPEAAGLLRDIEARK